jgi:hypothetical protein
VTQRAYRRFRFGVFALCWLGAAALQAYVADVGTHGAMVGAYLPAWLLLVANVPPVAVLAAAVVDALAALIALRMPLAIDRALVVANVVLLLAYAFAGVAVIFYVAFANNGVS